MKTTALLLALVMSGLNCVHADEEPEPELDGPVFASLIAPDPSDFASTVQLQQRLSSGELTSVALVQQLLARIEALNKKGPRLNAVIEVNPDALVIAAQMDKERAEGRDLGPLHGVPVLVKDVFDTSDKMQTSAGSLAMVGQPASKDAFVVQRLRESGAIILGKSNLSEWSNFRGRTIPHGWSGRGGQTRNPHNLDATTCGSSSGSAAAVAAGFVPVSVGTETNGSIICPAFRNGVVGIRPTVGLLSRAGVIPISSRQDTPGPMARTVTDAALLLSAMSGTDARDTATYQVPNGPVDYHALLDRDSLRGARLGYPLYGFGGVPMLADPEFIRVGKILKAAGATLVPVLLPNQAEGAFTWPLLQLDFKRELAVYLQTRSGLPVSTLADIIAFNASNPGEENYGQGNLEQAQQQSFSQTSYFRMTSALKNNNRMAIDNALRNHSLDALLDLSSGVLKSYGARAGYPGITVPSGFDDDGDPTGLYFFGTAWSEATLLSFAYAFEQALKDSSPAQPAPEAAAG
jgi:amidase